VIFIGKVIYRYL